MPIVCLVAALSVSFAAPDLGGDDLAQPEQFKLAGTWKIVSAISNGRPMPDTIRESARFVFDGKSLAISIGGEAKGRMTFKLDSTSRPKSIDLTGNEGPNKDQVVRGIYELAGDTLTINAADKPETARPTKMEAPEGSGHSLVILQRVDKRDVGTEKSDTE